MIEIEFIYIRKDGLPSRAFKTFYNVKKAVKFLYKIKNSKNMVFTGNFSCDDPNDTEYINSHFR